MNKHQWKAVYHFCEDNGYERPSELLNDLKNKGVVHRRETFDDLANYPKDGTYDSMIEWLQENV